MCSFKILLPTTQGKTSTKERRNQSQRTEGSSSCYYLVAILALLQFLFLCIHSRSLALDVQTQVLHKLNIIHVELLTHVALECHVRFELGLKYLE